jgi:hypothetical protein
VAKRYLQLLPLIAEVQPRTIVEVGTHRGLRAYALCEQALRFHSDVSYTGYDIFDTEPAQFQADAFNGKGMTTEGRATYRMDKLKLIAPTLQWRFVVGDTRTTLHGQTVAADFAFIDGDHRVDVIRGDAQALRDCAVIAFDDYYRKGASERMPDTTRYGSNVVVDELAAAGAKVSILPYYDVGKHGGRVHLAVVRRT